MSGVGVLRISDAASLALHTTVLLAAKAGHVVSTCEIASLLGVSEAHLSKVLQRLAHVGLVDSVRGPKGGFTLSHEPEKTTLLEVYQAIDGPLDHQNCLLGNSICGGKLCILGGLIENLNREVEEYLSHTTLTDLTRVYEGTPCLNVEK